MTRDELIGRGAAIAALTCVALVAVTAGAVAMPGVRSKLTFVSSPESGYRPGDRPDIPAAKFTERTRTILVFVRPDCVACRKGQSFVRRLVDDSRTRSGIGVRLVGRLQDQAALQQYARQVGLEESDVVTLEREQIKPKTVPTIIVVDSAGHAVYARSGAFPSAAADQKVLFQTVSGLVRQH